MFQTQTKVKLERKEKEKEQTSTAASTKAPTDEPTAAASTEAPTEELTEEASAASQSKLPKDPDEHANKSFVERIFGTKNKYNSFNYRLGQQAQEVRDEYNELKQAGDDEKLMELVTNIIESKSRLAPDSITRKRKQVDSNVKNVEEGWVSWAVAAANEGEDVLMELVESGAAVCRRHPQLSPDSKIPYPKNQQVWISNEKFRKQEGAIDETELNEQGEVDTNKHEEFLKDFANAKIKVKRDKPGSNIGRGKPESNIGAANVSDAASMVTSSSEKPKVIDEKTKIAIKNLRKSHSSWDRSRREFESAIQQSKKNENTKGSKIEQQLESLVNACNATDDMLIGLERIFMINGQLTDGQVLEASKLCAELKKDTDSAKELWNGLKSWFKL